MFIHVQISDREGKRLDHPVLWRWAAWKADCESWQQAQAISHKQRVQRFITEKNIHLIARGITRFSAIEGDLSRVLASLHLQRKHFNLIKNIFGVTIITREEEL